MIKKMIELLDARNFLGLKDYLKGMNSVDVAGCMEELDKEQLITVFRLLSKEQAVDTFSYMDSTQQEHLINSMTDKELADVTSELFLDDTVDLIEEMPANVVKRILGNTDEKSRFLINEFLNYPQDSAGSLMTIEFVDLKSFMTVREAFDRIRQTGLNKETVYTCYVLNERRKLQGVVTVKDLLLADMDKKISEIMETSPVTASTLEDKELVAKKFRKYDFLALPVVDNENRLVGIVTIDDAVDVIQDENTEDFEIMAAMTPSEESYFKTSVLRHAGNRIVWLLVLMLSATFSGMIISKYEAAFSSLPLLVAFIPMLMDTGGNCGSQSSTLIIRGMAVEEIRLKDFLKVLLKEVRVAAIVGVLLGLVNAGRIFLQYADNPEKASFALVTGLSLFLTVILAKMLGCMLPMLAKKVKVDPAIMASPLITTIVDTCSMLIYFNIAVRILSLKM